LDEAVWAQAQPLTYAEHPLVNDSTTAVVRLLWDDRYLYAGFDVNDTQVEDSSIENVWDGDSVGVIIENGGRIQEYRYTMLGDVSNRLHLIGDKAGIGTINRYEADLKGVTTFNDPSNQDEGYSVEMRIAWESPRAEGDTIAFDLWSIDHDYNPGKRFDHPDTIFSKISWDGDQSVDTARKSIFLSNTCFDAKIISPSGTDDKNTAAGFPITNTVTISWEPPECVMIVQSYQNNELKSDYRPVTSGTDINIGDPGSGETEIKIWSEGATEPSDSIWVWIEEPPGPPTLEIIELNPTGFETQDTDGDGIDDQFFLHTNYKQPDLDLPIQDGIDLSNYGLEFTFQGVDGRQAHLFYKSGQDYANVCSCPYPISSGQPIRYNPFADGREQSDPGFDFTHIWAIGARIPGGIEGVQIESARLIIRPTTPEGIIALNPACFETQNATNDGEVDEFILFTNKITPPFPANDGIDLSDYDLEFTFQGADGRTAYLWYKSAPNWDNLRSLPKETISDEQPIRYNPSVEGSEKRDPGFDFAHIWAIGARIPGGIEGVELNSARLIKR
jgi:hypothetical protein